MYKKRQKHALLMRRPNNRLVGLHSTTNRSYTSIFLFFFFVSTVHTLSKANLPFLSISHLLQVARYLVRYMCRMCAPLKLCDQ